MRIWKFNLDITDFQTITIPQGARMLAVQVQRGRPCLWALVDEKAAIESRAFATFGTGHPIPDEGLGQYIGTYQVGGGELVFHVFEWSVVSLDGALPQETMSDLQSNATDTATTFPATKVGHWPSGPVFVCDRHATALRNIGAALGMQVPISEPAPPGSICSNCVNEAEKQGKP